MARRTRTMDLAEYRLRPGDELLWTDKPDDPFKPDPSSYVSYLVDGSPFERLLWREIKHIQKRAKLTDWQSAVFECYLKGLSIRQTALIFSISDSTAQTHLDRAFNKTSRLSNLGILTVMIEELGWRAVRESLADKLEAKLRRKGG